MQDIDNEWWSSENNNVSEQPKETLIVTDNTFLPEQPHTFVDEYKIKYGYSAVGGRGVFATKNIQTGELIERCPLVPLVLRSKQQTDPAIWSYCYTKPLCDCNECKTNGFLFYMVLGHGMVYNHQDNNNAEMKFDHKNLFVDIIANRDIENGKEVFVTYGPKYFSNRPKTVVSHQ